MPFDVGNSLCALLSFVHSLVEMSARLLAKLEYAYQSIIRDITSYSYRVHSINSQISNRVWTWANSFLYCTWTESPTFISSLRGTLTIFRRGWPMHSFRSCTQGEPQLIHITITNSPQRSRRILLTRKVRQKWFSDSPHRGSQSESNNSRPAKTAC